ncbi:MAG: hypothetical protein V4677_02170 [Bacteroidota bacterium]
MIRSLFFVLVLSIHFYSFSQRSEIVQRSAVKHNYAIGFDYYVEDNIDTTRLLFMGVIQITSGNSDVSLVSATHLLKTKTKELNGNSYKLKSFSKQDTTLILLFDIYYASENQVKLIKQSRLKDQVIVFNNIKDTLTRRLNINDSMYSFKRSKYLIIDTKNKNVKIKIDSATTVRYNDRIKPGQIAEFITVKANNGAALLYSAAGATAGVVGVVIVATTESLINRHVKPGNEFLSNMNYLTGRILMNIYPMDKQIILN